MVILGIETSCDETGVGLLRDNKILVNLVASQDDIHRPYGGIMPELASRGHVSKIDRLFRLALKKSKLSPDKIDLIGVTTGPGLKGSLLVGASFSRGLSYRLGKPIYPVDHLQAHLAANFIGQGKYTFPALGLVISGGHTSLFYLSNYTEFKLIGRTLDDACGEAFDKVARILNLSYPGGPEIEKLARKGNPQAIKFPRSLLSKDSLDFSFSGLKTAVLYYVRDHGLKNTADIAASFQEAVKEVLIEKIRRAICRYKVVNFLLGGGVAQNMYIQSGIKNFLEANRMKFYCPEKKMCLDNGAMVAILTYHLHKTGLLPSKGLEIEVFPTTRDR